MYTKLTAIVLVGALAVVLITSATLAGADDANAKRKRHGNHGGDNNQASSQVNNCSNSQCQNANSQIQGSGNAVSINQNQN